MIPPTLRGLVAAVAAVLGVILAVVLAIVFALVGLPWWLGVLLGLVISAVAVWWLVAGSLDRTLATIGARLLRPDEHPRYENVVEGLSLTAGLAEPDLRVIDDPALNATALSWGDRHVIALTTGLLEACDRVELESIVAGAIVRIRSGDAERAVLAAGLVGRPLLDSPLAGVGRPLAAPVLERLFDAEREIEADQATVELTRYPPGLALALERIERGPYEPRTTSSALHHVWFAPPRPDPVVPHAPLAWRLDVLSEIR